MRFTPNKSFCGPCCCYCFSPHSFHPKRFRMQSFAFAQPNAISAHAHKILFISIRWVFVLVLLAYVLNVCAITNTLFYICLLKLFVFANSCYVRLWAAFQLIFLSFSLLFHSNIACWCWHFFVLSSFFFFFFCLVTLYRNAQKTIFICVRCSLTPTPPFSLMFSTEFTFHIQY